jgi:hypothetical protein
MGKMPNNDLKAPAGATEVLNTQMRPSASVAPTGLLSVGFF